MPCAHRPVHPGSLGVVMAGVEALTITEMRLPSTVIVGLDVSPMGPSPIVGESDMSGESDLSGANLYVNLHQKSKSWKIKNLPAKIAIGTLANQLILFISHYANNKII